MGTTGENARLNYLQEASKALTFTSPVVSSFLNASRVNLIADNASTDATDGQYCSGCAQYLFPGLTGNMVKSTKSKRTRQDRISGNQDYEQRVRCSRCGTENTITRTTKTRSRKSANVPLTGKTSFEKAICQSQPARPTPSADAPSTTPTAAPQSTTPARRKSRGKNASLQALLANKKPEAPKKSYGDLMDFMKT
jgi:hypothetical protein